MQKRYQNAGAAGTDGVAQGAGAAVDVDLVMREVEVAHGGHGDNGKRLVDFEQIDLVAVPAEPGQQLFDRTNGGGGEPGRVLGVTAVAADGGQRGQAAAFGV